ncbi:hypothetical protein GCM10010277_52590 [Streptomyces longisporoflavus]|uniref:hypothetical protein n=1 Tax=Streptomyces longisporoflavus TaxID=28044 RepID=UPI001996D201|nr:hypothetical protein [Streptomyces longisporoflavus]GGV54097.1 hypothetical protein GCM10010277_52590 [Streptomyces longisporoflavus]
MKRLRTGSALAALPLALALALTGCGSDDNGKGVASAGDDKKNAADAKESLSPQEMGVKFTQCLRENGLDVDDPEPGKPVALRFGPETDQTTVKKAMEACRKYNPQANGGGAGNPKMEEAGREFAECMRKNGVNMEDPEPGGGIMLKGELTKDPDFPKAKKKCDTILAEARPDEGGKDE